PTTMPFAGPPGCATWWPSAARSPPRSTPATSWPASRRPPAACGRARAPPCVRAAALAPVPAFDDARARLRAAAVSGPEWEDLPLERPAGAGLPGLVVERHEPVLVLDPLCHPRTLAPGWWERRPRATYYGVPINVGETFVGVLDYVLPEGAPD